MSKFIIKTVLGRRDIPVVYSYTTDSTGKEFSVKINIIVVACRLGYHSCQKMGFTLEGGYNRRA